MTLLHQAAQKAVEAPLRSCPFCGKSDTLKLTTAEELANEGEDDPVLWEHSPSWAVICDASQPLGPGGCGAEGGFYPSQEEALAAWNRRDESALQQPESDRLREVMRGALYYLRETRSGFIVKAVDLLEAEVGTGAVLPPALQHQEEPREPVAFHTGEALRRAGIVCGRCGCPDLMYEGVAASPSTTRQQEVGSRPPTKPEDAFLHRAVRESATLVAPGKLAAAPSTPENAGGVASIAQAQPSEGSDA